MLTIRCDTVEFAPKPRASRRSDAENKWHRCQLCGHRTYLPEECQSLVMLAIPAARTSAVWDADSGTLLHDCRHVRVMEEHAQHR